MGCMCGHGNNRIQAARSGFEQMTSLRMKQPVFWKHKPAPNFEKTPWKWVQAK
jgi:hypothetical protein